jgi:hypothetical protein
VGKTEGNNPLGRPMYRWEDNIKIDLPRNKTVLREMDLSASGQEPVVGSCEHSFEYSGSIKIRRITWLAEELSTY